MRELNLWGFNLNNKVYSGFSDIELMRLCEPNAGGLDLRLPCRKTAHLYHLLDMYSFDWCFRDWINWPKWLPLPIYSDHGVNLDGVFEQHELNSRPKTHITWFSDRAECLRKTNQKKILRVTHPWIVYRRKNNLTKSNNSRGTLIFYAHSTSGLEIADYDWDAYFAKLQSLPSEYHPLVICMHQNDIKKSYAHNIRKHGIPIVTAGWSGSPYFIDRFYNLIANFTYATSQIGGSELFYCEEFGVKYFIAGDDLRYVSYDNDGGVLQGFGGDLLANRINNLKKEIFKDLSESDSGRRRGLVSSVLGLDLDPVKCESELKKLVYTESLRHVDLMLLAAIVYLTPKRLKKFFRFILKKPQL